MRVATNLLLALLLAVPLDCIVLAQPPRNDPQAAKVAAYEKFRALEHIRFLKEDRIKRLEPRRRDYPLRYLNVTDEEIREITSAARDVVPRAIVNISGIVSGCPCEEGPQCTDQAWIEAFAPGNTRGLQLSKVGNHWKIGFVQRWWMARESLEARRDQFASNHEYLKAEDALVDSFPSCGIEPGR